MTSPDRRPAAPPETDPEGGPQDSRVPAEGPVQAAADAVVAWWQSANKALAPVLGARGVAALYQRSLHLSAALHPFLGAAPKNGPALQLPELRALLSRQTETQVAAAGAALANNLSVLLEGLIGPSLTHRLLIDVRAQPTSGPADQDKST